MIPKGICKKCAYRWQMGVQGQSSRPVCNRPGYCYPIKNLYMKQCEFYKPANEQQLKILRELGRR